MRRQGMDVDDRAALAALCSSAKRILAQQAELRGYRLVPARPVAEPTTDQQDRKQTGQLSLLDSVGAQASAATRSQPGAGGTVVQPRARRAQTHSIGAHTETRSVAELEELRTIALQCEQCGLAPTRTNVVFGVGDPQADVMFVGEAPGRDEDLQGEPFVGRAGQLLTAIIKATGLTRESVYIGNVLKCRPPGNRNPAPQEIEACSHFLWNQTRLIAPRVIVALGLFAAQRVIGRADSLTALRGRFHHYGRQPGILVLPTYHPAACLRFPRYKRLVWEDMQLLIRELGLKPPSLSDG